MINFVNIRTYAGTQAAITGDKWKAADHVLIKSQDELWQPATLLSIQKTSAKTANEALLVLILRNVIEREGWDPAHYADLDANLFLDFILSSGYLAREQGWLMEEETCREEVNEIIMGLKKSKNYGIFKNGKPADENELLKDNDFCLVRCFTNEWNYRQFFIETPVKWVFFDWGTSA